MHVMLGFLVVAFVADSSGLEHWLSVGMMFDPVVFALMSFVFDALLFLSREVIRFTPDWTVADAVLLMPGPSTHRSLLYATMGIL